MTENKAFIYTANELFDWLSIAPDFVLLDVRNEKDFSNFSVEGPQFLPYINIPYFDFIEDIDGGIAKVPPGQKVRIVCAKEGSAKFVADQLVENGFTDVGYLQGGIVSWGNMLAPREIAVGDGFELYQMIRPGKASCSYVLICGKEAAIFDPSRAVADYQQFVANKGATIVKTFETHRQADYISGSPGLQAKAGAEIIASAIDFKGAGFPFTPATDQGLFSLASGPEIKAIHTPGHTMGSTCFLVDDTYLIAGDSLFIQSAGRPDLGGKASEWSRYLYLSLMVVLRSMPDNTMILPGHYVSWEEANNDLIFMASLAEVKQHNVAFHFVHEKQFAQFIEDNLRPQPTVYGEIRKINGGWLEFDEQQQNEMDLGKNECGASNYGKVGVSAVEESKS